jgi:hypothetical protein
MLPLIEHFIRTNKEQVMARSLLHCHSPNLHSVMLMEKPGATIRFFFAGAGHRLWQNEPVCKEQSIAYHPHHCDVTFVRICGHPLNYTMRFHGGAPIDFTELGQYRYMSKINGKNGSFEFERWNHAYASREPQKITRHGLSLTANDIHTIFVPHGERAAWFVFEGKESDAYAPLCWSRSVPTITPDLYQPMTEQALTAIVGAIADEVRAER